MRRFLLPLLFAAVLTLGMIGTGHTLPTSLPITDTAWMAVAAISAVAAVPLFMLGTALDTRHHETAGIRKAEKRALRILKDEERRKTAEADAAELRLHKMANGENDDDLIAVQSNGHDHDGRIGFHY